MISDRVVTPYANRMLIRNATLLEQLCCPAEGSVRDYRDGEALRERDQRPAATARARRRGPVGGADLC